MARKAQAQQIRIYPQALMTENPSSEAFNAMAKNPLIILTPPTISASISDNKPKIYLTVPSMDFDNYGRDIAPPCRRIEIFDCPKTTEQLVAEWQHIGLLLIAYGSPNACTQAGLAQFRGNKLTLKMD